MSVLFAAMSMMRQEKEHPLQICRIPGPVLCAARGRALLLRKVKNLQKVSAQIEEGLYDGDMRKLSAGELSAICSNLARGCEKQYKDREAELYRQIADYFAAAAPDEEGADREVLADLVKNDLQKGYPDVRAAAAEEEDRGTLRICTWGEKVTNILNSLLQRYEREGESFLKDTRIWVCTVCGFVYVGDQAPELCPVCKVPAWKFEKVERRVPA